MEDNESLQRLEHKERMYRAMLEENLRKQRDLHAVEGKLRTDLTLIENDKYRLLKGGLVALALIVVSMGLSACQRSVYTRLQLTDYEIPCSADSCGKLPK